MNKMLDYYEETIYYCIRCGEDWATIAGAQGCCGIPRPPDSTTVYVCNKCGYTTEHEELIRRCEHERTP